MTHTEPASTPGDWLNVHEIDPLIRPLVPYFAELTTERLASLRTALATDDLETLRRTAHTIKGSAASYGFPRMAELAALIEREIQTPSSTGAISHHLDRLAAMHAQLQAVIAQAPEFFREQ